MVEDQINGDAWEAKVMEKFSQTEEMELLEIAGSFCTKLLHSIDQKKIDIRVGEEDEMTEDLLRENIARMAVILDALEMRYEDAAEREFGFLQTIENSFEQ